MRVYRSTSATVSLKSKPIYSHTVTSASGFTDKTVTNGTTYRYVVQAVVGIRHATSHTLTAVPVAPPATVTAVGGRVGVAVGLDDDIHEGRHGIPHLPLDQPSRPPDLTDPCRAARGHELARQLSSNRDDVLLRRGGRVVPRHGFHPRSDRWRDPGRRAVGVRFRH